MAVLFIFWGVESTVANQRLKTLIADIIKYQVHGKKENGKLLIFMITTRDYFDFSPIIEAIAKKSIDS